MSEHFQELEGARTVPTRNFKLTRRAVRDVARKRAIAAIYGEAGLGKTFSTKEAVDEVEDVVWHVFPIGTNPKALVLSLLELLTGVPHSGTLSRLEPILLKALRDRSPLIAIDEAQRLNHLCIEYLRHLHDDPQSRFALVLVGGNDCWNTLSRYPMVVSRVARRVAFRPLGLDELLEVLPAFHPLYEDNDLEIIRFVDERYARGNFRAWTLFTDTALDLLGSSDGQLTEELARNVFALIPGLPHG